MDEKTMTVKLQFKNEAKKMLDELTTNLEEIQRLQMENNQLLKKYFVELLKLNVSEN